MSAFTVCFHGACILPEKAELVLYTETTHDFLTCNTNVTSVNGVVLHEHILPTSAE